MAMPGRVARVSEACKEALSEIIQEEIKDPRLGLVTITRVEMPPDLRKARVWVSFYGSEEERILGMEILEHAKGLIRRSLGQRVRLKFLPELELRADLGSEQGLRIDKIIKELKEE
jgi:ribosome-binding factor A